MEGEGSKDWGCIRAGGGLNLEYGRRLMYRVVRGVGGKE